eukprot:UN13807
MAGPIASFHVSRSRLCDEIGSRGQFWILFVNLVQPRKNAKDEKFSSVLCKYDQNKRTMIVKGDNLVTELHELLKDKIYL